MRGKKWRMGRGWRGGGGGTSWQECWRWGVRGAGALGGKEAELLAGREALEGLSRHTARNNLNVKHKTLSKIFCCLYALPSKDNLNVNYKRNFTQIVFQNIGVEGFPCYKSVIRAVGLHNVGCPCEQVELEGVQAERFGIWNSFKQFIFQVLLHLRVALPGLSLVCKRGFRQVPLSTFIITKNLIINQETPTNNCLTGSVNFISSFHLKLCGGRQARDGKVVSEFRINK